MRKILGVAGLAAVLAAAPATALAAFPVFDQRPDQLETHRPGDRDATRSAATARAGEPAPREEASRGRQ